MTHTTNIHLHADDHVSAEELSTSDVVNINAATKNTIAVFVGAANAAVVLQFAWLLRDAALKHGATETGEDERGAA